MTTSCLISLICKMGQLIGHRVSVRLRELSLLGRCLAHRTRSISVTDCYLGRGPETWAGVCSVLAPHPRTIPYTQSTLHPVLQNCLNGDTPSGLFH